ncbi:hypothetical protein [Coleofasciculus sp. A1-SPW-01]|uniref:hypothetical protein n=1 Tax=Coleofasciculus sp. A1-SPW-01 TaxID=3070819 RepID=UPI0040629E1B
MGKIPNPLDFSALRETTGKVSSQSLTVEALKRSLRTVEALKRSLRTARSRVSPEMAMLRLKVNTSKSQVSDVAI